MSTVTLLIAVFLAGAGGMVVLLPLLQGEPEAPREGPRGTARQNQALETLWAEKLRVLRSIRDLDFDYDMGKLTDDVYTAQRINLITLGIAIMRRMDELEAEVAAQQARIEEAVAALRQAGQKAHS